MKEKIESLIGDKLEKLNVYVSDSFYEKNEGLKNLCIVLDSNEIIDMEKIVEATRIINPIIDEAKELEDFDVLDIYSREKGDDRSE